MGFHDATTVNMAGAKEELNALRWQWPISVVAGMSKRQPDLELMRRDCKAMVLILSHRGLSILWTEHQT